MSVTAATDRRKDAARRLPPVAFGDHCPGPPQPSGAAAVHCRARGGLPRAVPSYGAPDRIYPGRVRHGTSAYVAGQQSKTRFAPSDPALVRCTAAMPGMAGA
jgi:hypothetical protein